MLDNFRQAIAAAGLTAPETIIADGDLHRFASNGDRADDAGWYVLHGDGLPAGSFGCFRSGITQKWCSKSDRQMTREERAEYRRRIETANRQREQDEQRRHAEAAMRAQTIWETAAPAPVDHPYLQRKQVQPHGLRVDADNRLIVPVTIDGTVTSLQFIDVNGGKLFLPGGAVKGGTFTLETLCDAGTILLCEGFATGASLHEATSYPTVCGFSAGNLKTAALSLRRQHPVAAIVLAGDNDLHDDGTSNAGLDAAAAAAKAIGGVLAMPKFDGKKCDFNDIHVQRGLDAVKEAIATALKRRTQEPDALAGATRPDLDREEELSRLAALSPADYGSARKAASDQLGIPVTFLDAERDARRKADKQAITGQGAEITFEEIPAAADPVDGGALAVRLSEIFPRFVVLPRYGETVLALWVLFTYCYDEFEIAPRLDLRSPEKECGKTSVLGLLSRLVKRPLLSSGVTPSVIFRVISTYHPTLLIDEMDTFVNANEELRGILNSGHTKDAATILRNVGDQHEPRMFSTWAPMAFAHIGPIPDTLEQRSITLPMKRKKPSECVASLRQVGPAAGARRAEFRLLVSQIERWVTDEGPRLATVSPSIPDGLSGDRAADNWMPLLAIADSLGGNWPEHARQAALAFSGHSAMENESIKVELLTDIQMLYARDAVDRLASSDLCDRLAAMEERPWSEWKKGKPMTCHQLARQLKPFGVSSRTIRLAGQGTVKGYLIEDFADAFERYLPPPHSENPLSKRHNDTTRAQSGDDPLFQSVTEWSCYVSENGLNPAPRAECVSVTDRNPDYVEEWEIVDEA